MAPHNQQSSSSNLVSGDVVSINTDEGHLRALKEIYVRVSDNFQLLVSKEGNNNEIKDISYDNYIDEGGIEKTRTGRYIVRNTWNIIIEY